MSSTRIQKKSPILDTRYLDGTVGAVAKWSAAALRAAGSIPARNKYLYGLQIVVRDLAVCVCEFICKRIHDTGEFFLDSNVTHFAY